MKESIEIYDGYGRRLDYSILDLMCIPYSFVPRSTPPQIIMLPTSSTLNNTAPTTTCDIEAVNLGDTTREPIDRSVLGRPTLPKRSINRSATLMAFEGNYIKTCITMPSNFGIRSWRCYEAIIEALAVGLYLYATFILTSTVFLNADRAIIYSTVMIVCLSAIRVLATLF